MQMKLTIFLILISLLVIGCVGKPPIPDSQKISDTYDQIDTKILDSDSCKPWNDKECKTYVDGVNGKYVNWSGVISDKKDGVVYVQLPSDHRFLKKVSLYDVEKTTFDNLKIGQRITFQGQIKLTCNLTGCYNMWTKLKEIELHDVRI